MAAWFFLALAAVPLATKPIPTLTLVWHDSMRLFPKEGLAQLGNEIEALFSERGLSVRFHAAMENEDLRKIPEPRVNAVVLPDEGRFVVPTNSMAMAFGERGGKWGIFVFYAGVRRTLGYRENEGSPRHTFELARALARIMAHEVVHVLAPERGHADTGLMTEKLTRVNLLADRIALDSSSVEHLTRTMRRLSASLRPSPLLS